MSAFLIGGGFYYAASGKAFDAAAGLLVGILMGASAWSIRRRTPDRAVRKR